MHMHNHIIIAIVTVVILLQLIATDQGLTYIDQNNQSALTVHTRCLVNYKIMWVAVMECTWGGGGGGGG